MDAARHSHPVRRFLLRAGCAYAAFAVVALAFANDRSKYLPDGDGTQDRKNPKYNTNADDPFLVVPDLATAREIADKRKSKQEQAAMVPREPVRLESLSEIKITELKVILKADFRGSIEAIRKELDNCSTRKCVSACCTPASAASPKATCSWP